MEEKTKRIRFECRISEAEKTRFAELSAASGLSESEILRRWLAGRNVTSRTDQQLYRGLRSAGGLLKTSIVNLRAAGLLTPAIHVQFEEALKGINKATAAILEALK